MTNSDKKEGAFVGWWEGDRSFFGALLRCLGSSWRLGAVKRGLKNPYYVHSYAIYMLGYFYNRNLKVIIAWDVCCILDWLFRHPVCTISTSTYFLWPGVLIAASRLCYKGIPHCGSIDGTANWRQEIVLPFLSISAAAPCILKSGRASDKTAALKVTPLREERGNLFHFHPTALARRSLPSLFIPLPPHERINRDWTREGGHRGIISGDIWSGIGMRDRHGIVTIFKDSPNLARLAHGTEWRKIVSYIPSPAYSFPAALSEIWISVRPRARS